MIRIAVSQTAFEAIAATLPVGSVAFDPEPNEKGERLIWLETAVIDKLGAMRRPGESFSDVILRLVEIEGRGAKPSSESAGR
jgi:hypothetical protein